MLIALLLIFALCAAELAPDTYIGKAMRSMLIDAPTNAFRHMTPRKVLVGTIVTVVLLAIMIGSPEWVMMFGVGDLTIYLDIGVILLLTQVAAHLKPIFTRSAQITRNISARLIVWWSRIRGRARQRRSRSLGTPSSDNGEADEPGWAFAYLPTAHMSAMA